MNRLAFVLAAAVSVAALAARAESPDPSGQFAAHVNSVVSRAQVRAELDQARRDGQLLLPGDAGLTASQLAPVAYPAPALLAGKTREQVRAETLQAIRDGDILAPGEAGVTLRQRDPQRYLARGEGAPARLARALGANRQEH